MDDRDWIFLVILACAIYILTREYKMVWWPSSSGRMYYVKDLPDKQRAADHLEALETRMKSFLEKARQLFPDDPRLRRIQDRWTGSLSEVENIKDNVAYSLGKRAIHICVREKSGRLTDMNTSVFVLLHELAHVSSTTYGHDTQFWTNMKFLVELADRVGSYTYVDYDDHPGMLCGKKVGSNPLSCVKDKTCDSELTKK